METKAENFNLKLATLNAISCFILQSLKKAIRCELKNLAKIETVDFELNIDGKKAKVVCDRKWLWSLERSNKLKEFQISLENFIKSSIPQIFSNQTQVHFSEDYRYFKIPIAIKITRKYNNTTQIVNGEDLYQTHIPAKEFAKFMKQRCPQIKVLEPILSIAFENPIDKKDIKSVSIMPKVEGITLYELKKNLALKKQFAESIKRLALKLQEALLSEDEQLPNDTKTLLNIYFGLSEKLDLHDGNIIISEDFKITIIDSCRAW